jgi:hypothetical protein
MEKIVHNNKLATIHFKNLNNVEFSKAGDFENSIFKDEKILSIDTQPDFHGKFS